MVNNKPEINLEQFIINWNVRYPYDRLFRKKYNIVFGSKAHRELTIFDIAVDLKEEKVMAKFTQKNDQQGDVDLTGGKTITEMTEDEIQAGKSVKMTRREVDEEFDNLDLSKFNDNA
jgi:hypothetical protein